MQRYAEDTQLIAKGLLESFDVINLLLVLEEAFDVELVTGSFAAGGF